MRDKWVNRITAGASIGLMMVLATALGLLAGGYRSDLARRPSTFFTDDSGARALLLVMQRLFPGSSQWRQPLFALPDLVEARGSLFHAANAQRLATDLLVRQLCYQMGSNLTHEDDLIRFYQQEGGRQSSGPWRALFSELENLYLGFVSGQASSERRLCRLGQVVGLIHHELGHEH